jgi:endonuclease/exonuclease/phosphatase family metal-dependent hydrolase
MENSRPVRVVTFNTWKNDGDYAARLGAMAAGLRSLVPDVVLLQEVFRMADGAADTGRFLANALGLTLAYAPARRKLRRWRGHDADSESGLAVLVRGKVARVERLSLPIDPRGGERIALLADACLPGGRRMLAGCVHLSHLRDDAAGRRQQLEAVLAHPRWREPANLCVLGGDFNATADQPELAWLSAWGELAVTDACAQSRVRRSTHPMPACAGRPGRCIDFIFTVSPREEAVPRVLNAGVALDAPVAGVWASDHAAVFATVE